MRIGNPCWVKARGAVCASVLVASSLIVFGCDIAKAGNTPDDKLRDSQIAHILIEASQREVKLGELAQSKAATRPVKEFATTLVNDHNAANHTLNEVLAFRDVKPTFNAISAQIEKSAQMTTSTLDGLNGETFDNAYMALQVAMHQDMLRLLDFQLLQDIDDTQLRVEAMTLRSATEGHLNMAQDIVASLDRKER